VAAKVNDYAGTAREGDAQEARRLGLCFLLKRNNCLGFKAEGDKLLVSHFCYLEALG
jgi:hypothetical protein